MGIEVQHWSEARLMGWTDAESWLETRVEGTTYFDFPLQRAIVAEEPLELIKDIDPYGETVFNKLQMPTVIAEFERLSKFVERPAEQLSIDAILRVARAIQDKSHNYLIFIGD